MGGEQQEQGKEKLLSVRESSPEVLIADMVRSWAVSRLKASRLMADRAANLAVRAYEDGASVAEACELARRYVESWLRHPASATRRRLDLAQSA